MGVGRWCVGLEQTPVGQGCRRVVLPCGWLAPLILLADFEASAWE